MGWMVGLRFQIRDFSLLHKLEANLASYAVGIGGSSSTGGAAGA
jgi:hypothetical protein